MNETKAYIQSLYKDSHSLLNEMEAYAEEHHVPIMEKDGIEILKQLIRIHRPKNIFEIGTAIGYSAIQMALAYSGSKVTSVEREQTRYKVAVDNIARAGLEQQIDTHLGDAVSFINELAEDTQFDFVFVDAAKGQYKDYIEAIDSYVPTKGVIVIDNVLFKGYVSGASQENQRWVKIGEKIAKFNEWLMNNENYYTTIIESGDGIAIALKK
ncbi:SAM-dependent methyltransferase [Halalkalibacillus sediminis]|uniref:tRNA 5-hydroxyuridine methyltransferase n=1 Tax=Halalkalibacillus sediminis TaxID=2018042 RepID=A0A2I0QXL2_9BACI|nr:O-methyltransferase [Halalkalibacillus sediminis]PKR79076.1 SAM-dependent methyltransferase [Halalkalibacillus sediminis]